MENMKFFYLFFVLFAVFVLSQSNAFAIGKATFKVAKIHPQNGQPMVVKNLQLNCMREFDGKWNEQKVVISINKVKSIRVLEILPGERFPIHSELTMKDGEKVTLQFLDTCKNTAETSFGTMDVNFEDIAFLDFNPDLSKPDAVVPAPAQNSPTQGIVIDPAN